MDDALTPPFDEITAKEKNILEHLETAQVGVIGSLLIDERCAGEVFGSAKPEYFTDATCRAVFLTARNLWYERKPIDPIVISAALGGKASFLAEVMRRTPTAANVGYYLDILESAKRYLDIRHAALDILESTTLDDAMEAYERIGKTMTRTGKIESVSWTDCVMDYLDRMQDPAPLDYLTWGLPELDERLHVEPGDYVIIGAESSAGKTALALQFAYSQAAAGKSVGFFSLETKRQRLTNRLMAETQIAGIDMQRTKLKKLSPKDYERAGDAGVRSDNIPLRIITNAYRIEDIRSETIMSGYQIIYVDYLQLIRYPASSRHESVTNISIELHRLALELGVTVVALSQVTNSEKGGKRKAATKDDLRESDQLLQDAEVIMMLNKTSPNTRLLTVEKNKDEGMAVIDLKFDARHMSFGYLPPPKSNRDKPLPDNVTFEELPEDAGGPLPF